MSVTFTVPKDYAAVIAVGLSTSFLAGYHALLSNKWRRASGIRAPQYYADAQQMKADPKARTFTCAQRAHGNMLEVLPFFLFTLGWAGLRYPLPAAGLGLAWIFSRVIYAEGYVSSNPGNREAGFVGSALTLTALTGMAFWGTWEMYTGKW